MSTKKKASITDYVTPAQVTDYMTPTRFVRACLLQVPERVHEQTMREWIEDLIEEQFNVEDTTLITVGTSSSSSTSTRCDELANMLDSCIQLLSPPFIDATEHTKEGWQWCNSRYVSRKQVQKYTVDKTSAKRRSDRRLRAFWRHEHLSLKMEVATATHHSAARRTTRTTRPE